MIEGAEDVPDDVPKDVSTEMLISAMNKEKTLYELLNAPTTATRAELKKGYVELAKLSHPDARIGKTEVNEEVPDFGEIAAAWRVLGDSRTRKRYDRDLRAKEFAETAQRFANKRLEEAVPAVAAMLDKVAVPFLRRTKATTWAVGQAVAKGVSNISQKPSDRNSNQALTSAFVDAIEAGQQAGRVIDSIELNEKSLELEER
jgi:DnaJ-class molecular chaperone